MSNPNESLLLVLGDQLDPDSPVFRQARRDLDTVLMLEVREESTHVPSHKKRTALFLAGMRHFARALRRDGWSVDYVRLDDESNTQSIGSELKRAIDRHRPQRVHVVEPGDRRVESQIRAASEGRVDLTLFEDSSFTCSLEEFERWREGRKSLTMESFYRQRRRALDLLMVDGKPVGGRWNFDKENRRSLKSPPLVPAPLSFAPDDETSEVLALVEREFPRAPGSTEGFDWPVTATQARETLDDFVDNRLDGFGTFQDAMWIGQPYLHHSRLSAALNLKLISPQECVQRAIEAAEGGKIPLNDLEGFVRQIIGWREFIRGVFYTEGGDYVDRNALEQDGDLPEFFWTADTDMRCMADSLESVVENAYSHHIARLMVIGNFALIAGVRPLLVHEWFLAMYVDAVEWVTAPNVIGMSQYADGGVVGTKPYAGSGKYIQRMSNSCAQCRYDPKTRVGETACPFNTFYWDFLLRHRARFAKNHRMAMILKNLDRMDDDELAAIRARSDELRKTFGVR